MTNMASTDVLFGDVFCNRTAAKQDYFHSTSPAGKQIHEDIFHLTISRSDTIINPELFADH